MLFAIRFVTDTERLGYTQFCKHNNILMLGGVNNLLNLMVH